MYTTAAKNYVADCIHGTAGVKLGFEGVEVVSYVFTTENSPYEVMKYLLETTEETFANLSEELKEFVCDNLEEDSDIPEDGWEFIDDSY